MKKQFNRRDFLKLAGMLPLSMIAPGAANSLDRFGQAKSNTQNVIVVVYDAFSAYHLSMLGYGRKTTPNLSKLADRAVVYHRHYAGGNFTTPGTASLLTGTYPWTHRALQPNVKVLESFENQNIFSAFQNYYRIAYTHNIWANKLLEQFQRSLEEYIPWDRLFLRSYDKAIQELFKNDFDAFSVSWVQSMKSKEDGFAYSLFFSHFYEFLQELKIADVKEDFPRGIPATGGADLNFVLENATDWLGKRLAELPQPFMGYFHFLPPHGPYRTSREFYQKFDYDGYMPVEKPEDIFTQKISEENLIRKRREYDEFILYVDKEFGRFYNHLENSGLLDNTWIVFTSDHGEMFERGIDGHSVDALYEPLVRIPMLMFEPGRTERLDVYTPTSAVDVLPTMLHLTGQQIPGWTEGRVLPPYADSEDNQEQGIYVVRSNKTGHHDPINRASVVLVEGRYKLIYYIGYEEKSIDEMAKLFDVEQDPEELTDVYQANKHVGDRMLNQVKAELEKVNQPYL